MFRRENSWNARPSSLSLRALSTLADSCHRTAMSHAQLALLYSGSGPGPDFDPNSITEPAISLSAFANELVNDSARVTKAVLHLIFCSIFLQIPLLFISSRIHFSTGICSAICKMRSPAMLQIFARY